MKEIKYAVLYCVCENISFHFISNPDPELILDLDPLRQNVSDPDQQHWIMDITS